jgi:hypothetical protein
VLFTALAFAGGAGNLHSLTWVPISSAAGGWGSLAIETFDPPFRPIDFLGRTGRQLVTVSYEPDVKITHYGTRFSDRTLGCGDGTYSSHDKTIVAVATSRNKQWRCGALMEICGPGGCIIGVRQDSCPGCGTNHLDRQRMASTRSAARIRESAAPASRSTPLTACSRPRSTRAASPLRNRRASVSTTGLRRRRPTSAPDNSWILSPAQSRRAAPGNAGRGEFTGRSRWPLGTAGLAFGRTLDLTLEPGALNTPRLQRPGGFEDR